MDTASARFGIAEVLEDLDLSAHRADTPRYWMDFGNSRDMGQVILSTIGSIKQPASEKFTPVGSLPQVTAEFAELLTEGDSEDLPSCSLAEALEKQDLFVNSVLAQMGCSLLWQLFRKGYTEQRGVFVNLGNFRTVPVNL